MQCETFAKKIKRFSGMDIINDYAQNLRKWLNKAKQIIFGLFQNSE